ncbi:uncharacterized protein LOC129765301 [Toxorhynchites rutilus septentrionalis]|uniref:uncharacterized protein LOC129765301 n=1 Tax=Toxorhynchites rutilus septentrionalis TaxID=329112 RepID=UPI00247A3866|nr:uncharacterized protein LOC129765301 [Toxorhynchites rutilus septentrionalis]XP_055621433.1 uncharacterized protein LOC129765301 [Toxorhynchites rutilus septentrionalis]XP_055621434.1 uncharacterized protein LOC129765301 [Toxorhynchites rutilus septentrionalis]
MLMKGPDFLTSLFAVLLRFRQRNIAVCGDIREMFHQILVREEDKQSQRFLWRDEPSEAVQIWVVDVATFGATCSPSIAQYVKIKHAHQYFNSFPRAVSIIIDDHYVDDCLFSVDTVDEAVRLMQEVKAIHAAAGFELVKFQSNSMTVISLLGEADRTLCKPMKLDQQEEFDRVLGLMWIPGADIFTFQVPVDVHQIIDHATAPTKRQILRTVMKIFDPLGFLAHFVIHGKVLMQEVWRTGTGWDEPVAEHLVDQWFRWAKMPSQISEVQVPLFFFRDNDLWKFREVEIHVLTDASEEAYACVAYIRVPNDYGGRCSFLAAKTKVAPLKPLSFPRLELQAAMMGARLMQMVCSALTLNISKRILWTDSATVLAWLRSESRKYHQFVSFRVGEILSITRMDEWRHIPKKLNVADDATKWGSGPNFNPSCRWFQGPTFLNESEEHWPKESKGTLHETTEELREVVLHHSDIAEAVIDVERFSNWHRLLRTMAYVFKVASVGKKIIRDDSTYLSKDELIKAEGALLRQAQTQAYSSEIECLQKRMALVKSSSLYPLVPFLDEAGIIRVSGRTEGASLIPYSARYPIVLPKTHRVTMLIVDSYHKKFLHANGETVCNEIRQKFFIQSLRSLVWKVSRSCQLCMIRKAVPAPPLMSPLPKVRLTPFIRPFTKRRRLLRASGG